MTLRPLLFDFGNVLVKWDMHNIYDAHFSSPQAVDAFLKEIRFYEWNSLMDRGLPFNEGVARASAEFPQYAHLFQLFDDQWFQTVREPIEGSVAILRRLKEKGHPLYLLSNISAEKFPQASKAYTFLSWFDEIFISSKMRIIKPDPAIFEQALRRIQRPANEVVFIDDAPPNIESARKLGIASLLFESPEKLENDLRALNVF